MTHSPYPRKKKKKRKSLYRKSSYCVVSLCLQFVTNVKMYVRCMTLIITLHCMNDI